MNERQSCLRIKGLLRARLWGGYAPTVATERVFGTVVNAVDLDEDALGAVGFPAAMVWPGSATADENEPDIRQTEIIVDVLHRGAGDRLGEAALMGHGRASVTTSKAAGLLDIEAEVDSALRLLGPQQGLRMQLRATSAPSIVKLGGSHFLHRARVYSAWLTGSVGILPPTAFTATQNVSDVDLAWTAPAVTTGLVEYVVRRVSGTVPTPHPDLGTSVYSGSTVAAVTDTAPGAGTYTYSVFAGYDSLGGASGFDFSDFAYATITVT